MLKQVFSCGFHYGNLWKPRVKKNTTPGSPMMHPTRVKVTARMQRERVEPVPGTRNAGCRGDGHRDLSDTWWFKRHVNISWKARTGFKQILIVDLQKIFTATGMHTVARLTWEVQLTAFYKPCIGVLFGVIPPERSAERSSVACQEAQKRIPIDDTVKSGVYIFIYMYLCMQCIHIYYLNYITYTIYIYIYLYTYVLYIETYIETIISLYFSTPGFAIHISLHATAGHLRSRQPGLGAV